MKDRLFFSLVCAIIGLVFFAGSLFAVPSNKLMKLDVRTQEQATKIELLFSQPYVGVTQIDFQLGVARLTLPDVLTQLPTPYVLNNALLKEIQIVPMGFDTVLEIVFQNRFFDASGLVSIENQDGQLWVHLAQKPLPVVSSVETPASLWNKDFLQSIVKTTVALTFVLALIFGLLKLYQVFVAKKWLFYPKNYRPKVLAIYHLSGKQKLWLVDIFDQRFALGVTPQSVHLISKLEDEHMRFVQQWGNQAGEMDIAKLRVRFQQTHQPVEKNTEKKNILQITNAKAFKEELKRRISDLKPVK